MNPGEGEAEGEELALELGEAETELDGLGLELGEDEGLDDGELLGEVEGLVLAASAV